MSNDKTRAAIMALPDGHQIEEVWSSDKEGEQLFVYILTTNLKQFVADLEGERDQYKHLAEGRGKLLMLREQLDDALRGEE